MEKRSCIRTATPATRSPAARRWRRWRSSATNRCCERNRALAARLAARLAPLADHPNVAEVRQTGMIAAVELVRDKATRHAVSARSSAAACAPICMHSSAACCCARSAT